MLVFICIINKKMINEQVILSIYAIILVEIGILLLLLILVIVDIKNTIDSVRNLVNKFVKLGNFTVDGVEELKTKLTSLSTLTSFLGDVPAVWTFLKKIVDRGIYSDKESSSDELGKVLSKVSSNKKRRII